MQFRPENASLSMFTKAILGLVVATLLGCGGGGGSSTSVPSTPSTTYYTVKSTHVMSPKNCPTNVGLVGGCVDVNQQVSQFNVLNVPTTALFLTDGFFTRKTGATGLVYTAQNTNDIFEAETHSFVQLKDTPDIGIYVNGIDINTSIGATSINPIYHFADQALMPWKSPAADIELSFNLAVKTMRRTDKLNGYSQSHPVLELVDTRSKLHLYITLGVAAITPMSTTPETDFFARDFGIGTVIVSTTFRDNPSFGIRKSGGTIICDTDSTPCVGYGGHRFRLRPEDISFIVNKARTLEPLLSPTIADYAIDNFSFNSEVSGLAEVGISLSNYTLSVIPRQ